ncbi:DNA polymerase III subunit chi [Candidatus Methylocalor cossyra]|uniref:DNA polymerase III subunit chi n=1 Tax=Candidatus Methylocalor cossyra TaxID=3108543 RepID=A0ABM9NK13_9GAMM
MTRIDFYLVPGADPHGRRVTACRLIEKAYRQGHRVYLHTSSEEEARLLDELLWTFRQGSFVPHELFPGAAEEAPVWVGYGPAPDSLTDVLVNLAPEVPVGFERFQRLAEFIDEDEAVKRAGRRRYKAYKDAGYAPATHRLDGVGGPGSPGEAG